MLPINMRRLLGFLVMLMVLQCTPAKAQLLINEIMPANGDAIWDSQTDNQPSWIEIYNPGNSRVSLAGYTLSDDPLNPRKWTFPELISIAPRSYLLVWCDQKPGEMYTGFGLSANGEHLVLSAPDGLVIDRLIYPPQHLNVSYGRIADGASRWSFFPDATPGASNKGPYSDKVTTPPEFSVAAGPVSSGVQLILTSSIENAVIRFTSDGSEPDESATVYRSPISILRTTTIKARVFVEGMVPGKTRTRTYLVPDHQVRLPIISISTAPDYLWDEYSGIYVEGSNGIPGNCAENRNWNQDWERHAVLEYFNEQGVREEVQDVDIRVGGACSRNFPQKSLVVKARSKYGSDRIKVDLFPNRTVGEAGGFILRNSGNDFNVTHLRDAFAQRLAASRMDVDFLDYRPAVVYLNGDYWGIMNIREKADADYFRDNAGLEPEEMDLLEVGASNYGVRAVAGSTVVWDSYMAGLEAMDRTGDDAYEYIDQNIDIEEYISYAITEIYLANTDWPGNNVRFWRSNNPGSRFRWVLWDMDFAFALYEGFSNATHPTLHFATDAQQGGWPNPAFATLHLRLLLDNPKFRHRFAARLFTAMEDVFHPSNVSRMLDESAAVIASEIPYHKARWGGFESDWNNELNRMKRFAVDRYAFMKTYAREFFSFTENSLLTVSVSESGQGSFSVDGVQIPVGNFTAERPAEMPTRISAKPNPGYRFSRWHVNAFESDTVELVNQSTVWRYLDNGIYPGSAWIAPDYDDSSWSLGSGELGYGDGDEQTTLSFGSNVEQKHITSWFRSSFLLDDTASVRSLLATLKYDDGVVIYLNGIEVHRANLPEGVITTDTWAMAVADETAEHQINLPRQWLVTGLNILTAEVHQVSPASSDISFRMELSARLAGKSIRFEYDKPELAVNSAGSTEVVLEFEPDVRNRTGLVINEIAANNGGPSADIQDDWLELYNAGTDTIDLDGVMLTDNVSFPGKHVLRSSTGTWPLPPGDFLLLMADGRNMAGPLHLPFRLSAGGEYVGLHTASLEQIAVLDDLNYEGISKGASWACIPDGIRPMVATATVTPGYANAFAVGLPSVAQDEELQVFPNPFVNRLKFVTAPSAVELFNLSGQRISLRQEGGLELVVQDLPPGVYVLRYRISDRVFVRRMICTGN